MRNCTLSNNPGGGIIYTNAVGSGTATLMLRDSTLSGNTSGYGGGLQQFATSGGQANATVINSTFHNNTATGSNAGAAIDNDSGGGSASVVLVNCTLSGNTGTSTVYSLASTIQALNTIFVHGNGQNIITQGSGSSFTSLGHNLSDLPEGGDSGTGPGGVLGATGDKRNTNPLLGPLQRNGGLTFTRAIASNSPAYDAGDDAVLNPPYSLTTDEQGIPRKLSAHVDMGAFESELPQSGSIFTVNNLNDREDGTCGPLDCTLREALSAANANADANTITFSPGLTGLINNSTLTAGLPITHPLRSLVPERRPSSFGATL